MFASLGRINDPKINALEEFLVSPYCTNEIQPLVQELIGLLHIERPDDVTHNRINALEVQLKPYEEQIYGAPAESPVVSLAMHQGLRGAKNGTESLPPAVATQVGGVRDKTAKIMQFTSVPRKQ